LLVILLGLAFTIIGISLIVLKVYIHIVATKIDATVIGAFELKREKVKQRNGQSITELKKTLYAVVEFTNLTGETLTRLTSDGGSYVKKLTTGERVQIHVLFHRNGEEDIYIANNKSVWIMAAVFLSIGLMIMWQVGDIYASLGYSILSVIIALAALTYRLTTDRKPKSINNTSEYTLKKNFQKKDIKPIESFS
jgi:hypothetical protein